MSVYSFVFTGTDFNIKCGIWTSSDGVFVSNGLTDAVFANATAIFETPFSSNPNVTFETSYYLGCVPDGPEAGYYYDTDTNVSVAGFDSNNYTTPVDIGAPTTLNGQKISLFANYSCTDNCVDAFSLGGTYTWTAPTGVTSANIACWGGGGGGWDDTSGSNGGAGGGGGAFASSTVALTPTSSYTVTVATSSAENLPAVGTFSRFIGDDKTVLACGGTGATSVSVNGVGGTTACSTGDVEFAGGDGSDGSTTGDIGGGGGGSGGPNGAGSTPSGASGGVGANGGAANGGLVAGGAGGNTTNGSPGNSTAYGGSGGGGGDDGLAGGTGGSPGGGGGGAEGNGGLGAAGQCTITYTIAVEVEDPTIPFMSISGDVSLQGDIQLRR
jgi:hypothetical protein